MVLATGGAENGIAVAWHTPSEVKAAVSGNGAADKAQVTAMVSKLLRLSTPPKPADAADALALALCHVLRSPMLARIAAAERLVQAAAARRAEVAGSRPSGPPTARGTTGFGAAAVAPTRGSR